MQQRPDPGKKKKNAGCIFTSAGYWHRRAIHVLWKSELGARHERGLWQR